MTKTIQLTEQQLSRIIAEGQQEVNKQPLMRYNGHVVLRHDSNEIIRNGIVDGRGKQKSSYSKNSDATNYFWASELPGKDPSNASDIHYYCFVEPNAIYDMETNPKGYESVKDAMANERYVSGRWGDGAIAVMSNHPTPISFIVDNRPMNGPGAIYDAKWHMLRSKGVFHNKERNMQLAKKLKPYKDVEVPEFIGGYTYDDIVNFKTI